MPYEAEDLTGREPTRLVTEHHRMVQWVEAYPGRGERTCLNRRHVNVEEGIALYFIQGLGMSDGIGFALVQGATVVAFDVWKASGRHRPVEARAASLGTVTVPERMPWSREELLRRMQSAFTSYVQQEEAGMAYPFFDECALSVDGVRWEVLPEKYSALYVRQAFSRAWQRQRPRLGQLKDHLRSPLVALLLLALAAGWQVPTAWGPWGQTPMLLAAAWALRRCLSYDTDLLFGPWIVGLRRLRDPRQALARIYRFMQPLELDRVQARLHLSSDAVPVVQLTVTNPSWWPVQHLWVRSTTLAGLFDPAPSSGNVEARFPALRRRWLLPGQSVTWRLPGTAQAWPRPLPARLEVVLSMPRWATGERRSGLQTYWIPLAVGR